MRFKAVLMFEEGDNTETDGFAVIDKNATETDLTGATNSVISEIAVGDTVEIISPELRAEREQMESQNETLKAQIAESEKTITDLRGTSIANAATIADLKTKVNPQG